MALIHALPSATSYPNVYIVEKKFTQITVCPRSSDPFYVVTNYIKRVTTSWTDGRTKGESTGQVVTSHTTGRIQGGRGNCEQQSFSISLYLYCYFVLLCLGIQYISVPADTMEIV